MFCVTIAFFISSKYRVIANWSTVFAFPVAGGEAFLLPRISIRG
jgi:hypothetical protein